MAVEDSLAVASSGSGPTTASGGASQADGSLTFLCLPGMGDVRQSYRFLAPLLVEKVRRGRAVPPGSA